MNDRFAPGEGSREISAIEHVSHGDLHRLVVAVVRPRRLPRQHGHGMATAQERVHDMGADESGPPRYKNLQFKSPFLSFNIMEASDHPIPSGVAEQVADDLLSSAYTLDDLASGFAEPPQVPDRIGHAHGGKTRLTAAQEVSRSPGFKVLFRDEKSVGSGLENGKTASRLLTRPLSHDEGAPGRTGASADPPAELVKLREAEDFRIFNHHECGLGNVDADFHDGRRDEDPDPAGREIRQGARTLFRRHAAVQRPDRH